MISKGSVGNHLHLQKRHVVGQEYAKKVLSVAVYNHYKRIYNNLPEQNLKMQTNNNLISTQETGVGFQHTVNLESEQKTSSQSADGSAILDSKQHQLKLGKSNIMLLGPTGSGKTLLAQTIAQYLDVPFAICDCSTLSQAGYMGEDTESVIVKLLRNADYKVKRAQIGIVFLDEVDKIRATPGERDVAGQGVQQELLKMLEGTIMNVPESTRRQHGQMFQVDTTNILFIASGAYCGLDKLIARRKSGKNPGFDAAPTTESPDERAATLADIANMSLSTERNSKEKDTLLQQVVAKDLIDFGMIPEFVGRFSVFVPFHNLDKDMLVRILTEPQNAIVPQYEMLFSIDKVKLTFDIDALNIIASQAMEGEMGARGLRGIMEALLLEPMFEVPGSDIIFKYLDRRVVGQDTAKKILSVAVYNHYKRVYINLQNSQMQTNKNRIDMQETNHPFTPKPHSLDESYIENPFPFQSPWNIVHDQQFQLKLKKSNILLLGPMGCGKTLLAQTVAQYLNVPFASCDCTTLTEPRYVGENIESVIAKLLQDANYVVDRAQMGIVFLDNVDRIGTMSRIHPFQDMDGAQMQLSMLKMLEGMIVNVLKSTRKLHGEMLQVDTTNILFIASGTYSGLDCIIAHRISGKYPGFGPVPTAENPDERVPNLANIAMLFSTERNEEKDTLLQQVKARDLIHFGMMPEFIDRFPVLIPFHNLDRNMLVTILVESKNAIVPQYQILFSMDKVELTFDIEALNAIASLAMEKKTGAGDLQAIMQSLLLEPMFEVPGSDIISIHITEEYVKGHENPHYVTSSDNSSKDNIQQHAQNSSKDNIQQHAQNSSKDNIQQHVQN
ncbi:atp-dependent clp protease atp-binding subunit clpx- mitochondrial [Lasius niger]|uniref:Atp-dependent clp protease atp-binding subunit clpx-mitochondrial n=1 Tax=Lasius niger TaxID=67767 RepID=A0A0J7L4J8_LASNI|nr:atp-dependent clp protease atp-binding subunit clpx- mitochondrial [Lasius niger]